MIFNLSKTRFFESDGQTFVAGPKTFRLNEINLKGEGGLLCPDGVRIFSNDDKQVPVLNVELPEHLRDEISKMEETLVEKLQEKCPEFLSGTQKFYSCLKGDDKNQLVFKLNDKTKITYFDVKKSSIVKGKQGEILPGSRVCLEFNIGHPWKMDIENKTCWGIPLRISEMVVYLTGEKVEKEKRKSMVDEINALKKRKTKVMDYKKDEE